MAPLAMIQCGLLSFLAGEIPELLIQWEKGNCCGITTILVLLMSGICAFVLNVTSFMANKLTSPLTLCIASNVKQVLMIALGTFIFGTEITIMNGLGIIVVLLGSAQYSYLCMKEKKGILVREKTGSAISLSTPKLSNGATIDLEDGTESLLSSISKRRLTSKNIHGNVSCPSGVDADDS